MNARNALVSLAAAINEVAGKVGYDKAVVLGKKEGFDRPTLCWDGPYDWTMITGGSSVFAGEIGDYSQPCEPEIQAVLDKVEAAGLFFEPINNSQMGAHRNG